MSQQSPTSYPSQTPWHHPNPAEGQYPPAKRQRLSPNPPGSSQSPNAPSSTQSPYANVSNYQNFGIPSNAFANRQQVNGGGGGGSDNHHGGYQQQRQYSSQQIQQSRPNAGVMGPPQRPVERPSEKAANKKEEKVDVNDLSDLVFSSGIDIREEENYLHQTYRADLNQGSSNTQTSTSFSPQQNFPAHTQSFQGVIAAQHGNLPPTSNRNTQDVIYEEHKRVARQLNEKNQHHLANPFLLGNCVRTKLENVATDNGVTLPVEGLFDRIPNAGRSLNTSTSSITNANGSITVTRAPSLLNKGAPLDAMLSLLSIAANERLRNMLEDAHGLAKSRQTQSDGVVPSEWSDLVRKVGTEPTDAASTSVTKTAWDRPQGTTKSPLTSVENPGLPSPPPSVDSNITSKPQPTIALSQQSNALANALTTLSARDRAAEDARIKKRAARQARRNAAAAATNEETSNAEANAIIQQVNEKAPEIKMTKKEKERLAKQDQTDEVQTRHANAVAAMQTGGKRYSWMTQGAGAGARRPMPAVSSSKKAEVKADSNAAGKKDKDKDAKEEKGEAKYGDWREDGPGGKGVQLRDWVSVLEADGHEIRTLYKAFAKLGAESIGIPPREPPPLIDTNMSNQYQGQDSNQSSGQFNGGNTPSATPGYAGQTTPGGYNIHYGGTPYSAGSTAPPTPSGPLAASAPVSTRNTPGPQGYSHNENAIRPPMQQQASSPNLPYGQNQAQTSLRSPSVGHGQTPSPSPGQGRSPITGQSVYPPPSSSLAQGQVRSPAQPNGQTWTPQPQQQ